MSKRANDHLELATDILESIKGRPRKVYLKRAVSNAYYAMFHCLAESNANNIAGRSKANRSEGAWLQTYRALGHREAKRRCRNQQMIRKFPAALREFANTFCDLQIKREEADYNPNSQLYLQEAWWQVLLAEEAIESFKATATRDRKAFAVYLLIDLRKP